MTGRAQRALAWGLAKEGIGTTVSPTPSLLVRQPGTSAGDIGRCIMMGVLGFG